MVNRLKIYKSVAVMLLAYILNLASWSIARLIKMKYARKIGGVRIFDMTRQSKGKIGAAVAGDVLILFGKGRTIKDGLVRHEVTHLRQLRRLGLFKFFSYYSTEEGRVALELEAYLEQYAFLLRNSIRRKGIKDLDKKIFEYAEFLESVFKDLYKVSVPIEELEWAVSSMTEKVIDEIKQG